MLVKSEYGVLGFPNVMFIAEGACHDVDVTGVSGEPVRMCLMWGNRFHYMGYE